MSDPRIRVDGGEVSDPHAPPPEKRWVALALLVAAVLAIGLTFSYFESLPSEEPLELTAPLPQTSAAPVQAPTTTIPAIAVGWQRLDLPGRGTVVDLANGGGRWMALAKGEATTISTSQDARVWLTRTFPGTLDG